MQSTDDKAGIDEPLVMVCVCSLRPLQFLFRLIPTHMGGTQALHSRLIDR